MPNNIHKITLPTGFSIGNVNVYLIKGEPVTLIDTGVNGAISEHIFNKHLKEIGIEFKDIEQIIITHTHLDHCGLAGRIQELSGAKVFVHKSKVKEIKKFSDSYLKQPKNLKSFYMESAVPKHIYSRSYTKRQQSVYLGSSVHNPMALDDGDSIEFNNLNFKVIHTPGHTDDLICLYNEKSELLFSSDHITLHHVPFIQFREVYKSKGGSFGCLGDYLESLKIIENIPIKTTLPGHGDVLENPLSLINDIKKFYIDRKEKLAEELKRGIKSRFELSRTLFGYLNDRELFKGIPEITGHLEMLEEEGRLTKSLENGIMYYSSKN